MSQKVSIHIEVIIDSGDRSEYFAIANSIPELVRAHYGDISVTVEDAITSDVDSEFALTEQ